MERLSFNIYKKEDAEFESLEELYLGLEFLFYEQGLSLYEIFNYPLDQINTPSEKKGIADLLASYTMRKLIVSSIDAEVIMKRWIHYFKLCDELNWSDKKPKRFITRYNEALEYSGLEPITYYADRYGKEWFYREDNAYICCGHFPCDEKGQPIMKWIGIKVKNAKSITYDADKSREGILIIELTPSTSIHAVCQYIPRENGEDVFADIQENEDEEYWLQIYEGPLNMQFNHKALKEIRVSKGTTQAELAGAIGASVRTYQKWEGGETTLDGHHLLRIINWLNITDVQELTNYMVQNKLHYAAHGHAAEVIYERADASRSLMGLKSFSGDFPASKDISIAKNYLNDEYIETTVLLSHKSPNCTTSVKAEFGDGKGKCF